MTSDGECMKYQISPTLTQLEIRSDGETLIFKNNLFSLSSTLRDGNGNVIATLKRRNWWRLSFLLTTHNDVYDIVRKWGELSILSTSTGEQFKTNSSIELYTDKGIRVTKFIRVKNLSANYTLSIQTTTHVIALLMASCLLYKTNIELSGSSGCG